LIYFTALIIKYLRIMPVWIPLAAQLAGQAFGLAGSANDNNKLNSMIANKQRDITSLFNEQSSTDFADTELGASQVRSMKDLYQKQVAQADQSLASTGATTEAKIGARSKAAENYNEALNKLTGYGMSYRDSLRRDYQGQLNSMFNMQLQQQAGKQNTWGAIMTNAAQLGSGLAGLFPEAGAGAGAGVTPEVKTTT